jgi:cyclophilin family peptidyl-prolyl cis-trans isomerase
VDDGFYDGTIFHRVIPDFVVQGGGFEPGLVEKDTRDMIVNEATNGLKNTRGSIAMARRNEPDSATSQFYFNVADNTSLDYTSTSPGYTVFGWVIRGMSVVDQIATVQTESRDGFDDVPVEDVLIESIERITP